MKVDKDTLVEECLELISLHKNVDCSQRKSESEADWYLRLLEYVTDITHEHSKSTARDRSISLCRGLRELINENASGHPGH